MKSQSDLQLYSKRLTQQLESCIYWLTVIVRIFIETIMRVAYK